jgi:hypothetical protein
VILFLQAAAKLKQPLELALEALQSKPQFLPRSHRLEL